MDVRSHSGTDMDVMCSPACNMASASSGVNSGPMHDGALIAEMDTLSGTFPDGLPVMSREVGHNFSSSDHVSVSKPLNESQSVVGTEAPVSKCTQYPDVPDFAGS